MEPRGQEVLVPCFPVALGLVSAAARAEYPYFVVFVVYLVHLFRTRVDVNRTLAIFFLQPPQVKLVVQVAAFRTSVAVILLSKIAHND